MSLAAQYIHVLLFAYPNFGVQSCVRERENGNWRRTTEASSGLRKLNVSGSGGRNRWGRHRDVPRRNRYDIGLGPGLPLTLTSVGMDQGIAFLPVSQLQARIKNQTLSVSKKCALVDCYDDPEPCWEACRENPQSPSYGSTAGENDLKARAKVPMIHLQLTQDLL